MNIELSWLGLNWKYEQAFEQAIAKIQGWLDAFVASLPNLIVALIVLLITWTIAAVISAGLRRGLRTVGAIEGRGTQIGDLIASFTRIAITLAGWIVALSILNLRGPVSSILAGLGIIGFGLSIAFREIAANFMSGVMLAFRSPFRIGDLVDIDGHVGYVREITLQATLVRNFSGQNVYLRNNEVYNTAIINYTQHGLRRVEVPLQVSYGTDLEEVKQIAVDALEDIEGRDDAQGIQAYYRSFDASGVGLELHFWIPSHYDIFQARSDALIKLHAALERAGHSIPYPVRSVRIDDQTGDARTADTAPSQQRPTPHTSPTSSDVDQHDTYEDHGGTDTPAAQVKLDVPDDTDEDERQRLHDQLQHAGWSRAKDDDDARRSLWQTPLHSATKVRQVLQLSAENARVEGVRAVIKLGDKVVRLSSSHIQEDEGGDERDTSDQNEQDGDAEAAH